MYGRASPMAQSAIVTTSTTSPAGAGGDCMQRHGEGRVGKAARRRSRASRKAPTTVFNTDTTNFRAMVQQFTGGPSRAPFQAAFPLMEDAVGSPSTLTFGLAAGAAAQQLQQQPAVSPALGVQQRYPHFLQHRERPVFMPGGTGSGDVYLPRFGSSNPHSQRDIADSPDGFLLERISSFQMMPRPAASTGSTTTDGFLL